MEGKELDTEYVRLWFSDGILHGAYKKGLNIDLEIAQEIVKTRLEYTNHEPVLAVIEDMGVASMSKEARDFFSSPDGSKGMLASALILRSSFGMLLGNFFLKVTKPKVPAKIFTDKTKALEWLNQYKT